MKKTYLYAGVALLGIGMFIGGIITSIIFFGILSAASMIMLVESNLKFKWYVARCGFIIDLILFILSLLAVAYLGVTIAGGLCVASLLFTMYRITFLVPWLKRNKKLFGTITGNIARGFSSVVASIKSFFNSKKSVS